MNNNTLKSNSWKIKIGIEVHAQMLIENKIFSPTKCADENANPNTHIDLLDIGMPGALPIINPDAIKIGIKSSLALGCKIKETIDFDRKHYTYQDLPVGYQITQDRLAIGHDGAVEISDNKKIRIEKLHIECDAAKTINSNEYNGIDFNRSCSGLMEIVSYPDIENSDQAAEYVKNIRAVLMAIGSCDGSMENGSMRCDVNLSVYRDENDPKTPVEIKNINSLKFIQIAINYEAKRQIKLIESGEIIAKQTRLFDAKTKATHFMRNKEGRNDYCYFPDMDLTPINISKEIIENIKSTISNLPKDKYNTYINLGLENNTANTLAFEMDLGQYFDYMIDKIKNTKHDNQKKYQVIANFIVNVLFGLKNYKQISFESIYKSLIMFVEGKISNVSIRDLLSIIAENPIDNQKNDKFNELLSKFSISEDSNELINKLIQELIAENPNEIERYKNGDKKLSGWFVGTAMKKSKVKLNPKEILSALNKELNL